MDDPSAWHRDDRILTEWEYARACMTHEARTRTSR